MRLYTRSTNAATATAATRVAYSDNINNLVAALAVADTDGTKCEALLPVIDTLHTFERVAIVRHLDDVYNTERQALVASMTNEEVLAWITLTDDAEERSLLVNEAGQRAYALGFEVEDSAEGQWCMNDWNQAAHEHRVVEFLRGA